MTTISRALVTIKRSKVTFGEDLRTLKFAGVFRNGVEVSTGIKVDDYSQQTRKNVQSMTDKMASEFALRCKINRANHDTEIEIGGQTMSINDALTYKTHILPQLKELHTRLVRDLASNRTAYTTYERDFDSKLVKTSDEELKTLLEKRERPSILDTQEYIDKLKKEIDFFDLEFDAILTENNPLIVLS